MRTLGQAVDPKVAYVVDSILVTEDPQKGDDILNDDVSDLTIVRNKDSLKLLGYEQFDAVSFVSYYIELPIMVLMYFAWKIIKRTKIVKLEDMDLETDRYYGEVDVTPSAKGWKEKVRYALTWLF